VVETDVHYPTDINLLFDAMRKVITLLARVCAALGLSEWRQSAYTLRKLKRLYRKAQSLKRSQAKKKERVEQKRDRIARAHRAYTDVAEAYLEKAKATLEVLAETNRITAITYNSIKHYIRHAERQIDQTRRRVLMGERIPHQEKVFSIFEEHTEWISKGKAGVPQELGLKVCVVEDQYGFFLHHLVMRNTTDEKVAVSLIEATRKRFPQLVSCSFDKNFYTPGNRKQLERMLDLVVLPKKGRLSEEEKAAESTKEFVQGRKKHPAVESGINALENHGLDRCLDHGLRGFERYVGLAIVARNIQILGTILWTRENDKIQREQTRLRKAS
jgi:IS5 family transposase